ncbi:ExbD/TolR family protein [Cerasicoccus fimbriatus]|uniref:ExbD/TolR family protein n=1 Tax=Cerasicoccus fimbriatus TaxID=3014554 RepID=UPI0022B35AB2|nr:biopolymer transporter ExbD [Cerasicoccus sp. TK19100]
MSLRARRQSRIKPPTLTDINLSPLIDMVFILLIFFVVTTVFVKETGVKVDRPTANAASEVDPENILIAIDEHGQIFHDERPVSLSEVGMIVRRYSQRAPRPVVLIADKTVTTDVLVNVIDEATIAGAPSVSIAARQEGP